MKTKPQVRRKANAPRAAKQAANTSEQPPAEFKIVRLRECPVDNPILNCPEAAEQFWREHVSTAQWFNADKECLVIFALNVRRKLIGFEMLSQGTKDTVLVNTAEAFRLAIARNASAIIIAHNHPSGDPSPSEADITVTRDMIRAGALLKIEVLDHVVIGSAAAGRAGCASLRGLGCFNPEPARDTQEHATAPARVEPRLYPHLDLEESIQSTCALVELFRAKLFAFMEADEDDVSQSACCGLDELANDVLRKLLGDYRGALKEWQAVKLAQQRLAA